MIPCAFLIALAVVVYINAQEIASWLERKRHRKW